MKAQRKELRDDYNLWYGADELVSILTRYIPNVEVNLPAVDLNALDKQLGHVQNQGQYFIPLNVNGISKGFEESRNNHWVGLYVITSEDKLTVKYLDTMGHPINSYLERVIKDKLGIHNIEQPLQAQGIQFVQQVSEIELEGNTDDCGPFLIYCMTCLANNKSLELGINTLEQSISLGRFLRESFNRSSDFKEIYQTVSGDIISELEKVVGQLEVLGIESTDTKQENKEHKSVTTKSNFLPKKQPNILELVGTIINKIKGGYETIVNDHDEVILVIGKTGAGKSTLVNYLTNPEKMEVKLYKAPNIKYGKGSLVIDILKGSSGLPKPGHTKDSETTIPNKWQDSGSGIVYWDCPGFGDNQGADQDIANAFFIKKIFETSNKIKLILAISWEDLENGRANEIKNLTDTLGTLFNDFSIIKDSLSLIITKIPDSKDSDDVKGELEKLLQAKCFQEESVAKNILEFFLDSDNKISLFNQPTKPGPVIEVLGLDDQAQILDTVRNTKFINSPQVTIAVAPTSQIKIRELADLIHHEINSVILKLTEKYLIQHGCTKWNGNLRYSKNDLIDFVQSFKEGSEILENFINSIKLSKSEEIEELSEIEKAEKIIGEINTIFKYNDISKEHKELKQYIDTFKFFIQVSPDAQNSLATSDFVQNFQMASDVINQNLDTAEGHLIRILVDEAENLLKKFVEAVKDRLHDELAQAIEQNDPRLVESCQKYVNEISNLFSKKLTLETLVFFEEKLKEYGLKANLDELKLHGKVFDILSAESKQHYNSVLDKVVRPLHILEREYDSAIKDIEIAVHNEFEKYFHQFISSVNQLKSKDLVQLQDLIRQLDGCVVGLQHQSDAVSFVDVTLKTWPEVDFLIMAKEEAKKINVLNEIGIKIQLINESKLSNYVEQLKGVKYKLEVIFIKEVESKITNYIDQCISQIKEGCNKLSQSQKSELLDVIAKREIFQGEDFFECIGQLGRLIERKFNDLISITEVVEELSALKELGSIVNNLTMIDIFSNKMLRLSEYIVSDEAIQNFVLGIKGYVETIEKESNNIEDIPPYLKKLNTLFSNVFEFSGLKIAAFVKQMQENLILQIGEHPKIQECLTYLEAMKNTEGNVDYQNHLNPLLRLGKEIKDSLDWYNSVKPIHEIIIEKGYLFANDYPAINRDNFIEFLKILQSNGLKLTQEISYHDYKAEQLNNLLNHSWSKPKITKSSAEVTIEGECIKASDVVKYISSNIKLVKIKCLNTILFDQDIQAKGVSLVVIAPLWNVMQSIKVDLSGKDSGPNLSVKARDGIGYKSGGIGSDGCNGLSGSTGGHSGHFYGIGHKFIDLQRITFDLKGGRGGDGQNGGNGSSGQNGLDATITDFWEGKGIWQPNERDMKTKFDKMYNRIELCKGHLGYKGGDGGKGGLGGKVGEAGKVKILNSIGEEWKLEFPYEETRNGKDGISGLSGIGGKYGNDLKVYYYQNQYTTLRGSEPVLINLHAHNGSSPIEKNFTHHQHFFRVVDLEKSIVPKMKQEAKLLKDKVDTSDFYYKVQSPVLEKFSGLFGDGCSIKKIGEQEADWGYVKEFNRYYDDGIETILKLRIEHSGINQDKNVKLLKAKYLLDHDINNISTLVQDLDNIFSEEDIVLVPYNLYRAHWVGMIFEKVDDNVIIKYIDSENNSIPEKLEKELVARLNDIGYKVEFIQEVLSYQQTNNCGPEVIENFIWYLTGARLPQEKAVPFHSQLLEEALLFQSNENDVVSLVHLVGTEIEYI
ncbi:MAG: 50S ribosome-binding GTPase (plasmid) [Candidatus Megaira endosymbiont of Mesostigma viride]|nr:MAG: 50S ribosome-binding GTPase [Candidatus Megaira endosymbiont of Mesostigma viride]HJK89036.1 50S ribosome-binding GTPase [Candidatus Megaira endosymbiont of Mesostigma viride]